MPTAWKQLLTVFFATFLLIAARISVAQPALEDPSSNEDLQVLLEEMNAYQTGAPAPKSPRESALEALLVETQTRAITAEGKLLTCQAEVAALKESP